MFTTYRDKHVKIGLLQCEPAIVDGCNTVENRKGCFSSMLTSVA